MPTIGFSNKNNVWTSRYSYAASDFARVRDTFISSPNSPFTNAENDSPIWIHGRSSDYNKFYGASYGSSLTVAFNEKSSTNKIYKNFSIESTGNLDNSLAVFKSNNHIDNYEFHNAWQGINTSIGFVKTINGTTYGPLGQDSRLVPGKTLINLGRVIVGPGGTATEQIRSYESAIDNKLVQGHVRVYLDPNTGISPQIIQTEPLKMSVMILVVDLGGGNGTYRTETQQQNIPANSIAQYTYSQVAGSGKTVYNDGSFSQEQTAYDPSLHTINLANELGQAEEMRVKIEFAHNVVLGTDVLQETYLIGVPHPSLAGDAVRGKFAETKISIPPSKGYFEINALNVQYEPIQLAHDK